MFLTIALPIYNKEKYLKDCVNSILEQNSHNFELLLVNDGSTDNSLKICMDIQSAYPNTVRVINKENRGSLLTRRVCIEEAKGEYILILDGDDYLIDKNATLKIQDKIQKTKCDLLIFNYTEDEKNHKKKAFFCENSGDVMYESKEFLYHLATKDTSCLNPLFNKVFSKEIVDHEDYTTCGWISNGTDYFQMLALLTNAKKVVYMDEILYYYRIVHKSISHSFNIKTFMSLKEGYYRLVRVSNKWEIRDIATFKKELLAKKIRICTTSAFKCRMCIWKERKKALNYLKEISQDTFYIESYKESKNSKICGIGRKLILILLYKQWFHAIYIISRIIHVITQK